MSSFQLQFACLRGKTLRTRETQSSPVMDASRHLICRIKERAHFFTMHKYLITIISCSIPLAQIKSRRFNDDNDVGYEISYPADNDIK